MSNDITDILTGEKTKKSARSTSWEIGIYPNQARSFTAVGERPKDVVKALAKHLPDSLSDATITIRWAKPDPLDENQWKYEGHLFVCDGDYPAQRPLLDEES